MTNGLYSLTPSFGMVADAVNKTCNSSRRGLSNFIQVHYPKRDHDRKKRTSEILSHVGFFTLIFHAAVVLG